MSEDAYRHVYVTRAEFDEYKALQAKAKKQSGKPPFVLRNGHAALVNLFFTISAALGAGLLYDVKPAGLCAGLAAAAITFGAINLICAICLNLICAICLADSGATKPFGQTKWD